MALAVALVAVVVVVVAMVVMITTVMSVLVINNNVAHNEISFSSSYSMYVLTRESA